IFSRDWSSDVCSSDLVELDGGVHTLAAHFGEVFFEGREGGFARQDVDLARRPIPPVEDLVHELEDVLAGLDGVGLACATVALERSEERREGKEGRCRG